MKEIGHRISIFKHTSPNEGSVITITGKDGTKNYHVQSVTTHIAVHRHNCEDWLYAATDSNGQFIFFLERIKYECLKTVFFPEEAQNAEQYKYTADGVFYYQKNGQWYILNKENILLGKKILPEFFVKKDEDNSYIITHEQDCSSSTFKCKSYKIATDDNNEKCLLLGGVNEKREHFTILNKHGLVSPFNYFFALNIDGEHTLFRNEGNYWITPDRKVPEELYQFDQD